eukprot:gene15576-24421_t
MSGHPTLPLAAAVERQQGWDAGVAALEWQGERLGAPGTSLADLGIGAEAVLALVVDPEFSAAPSFQGSREGFVFKMGQRGLGFVFKMGQPRLGFVFKMGQRGLGYYKDRRRHALGVVARAERHGRGEVELKLAAEAACGPIRSGT